MLGRWTALLLCRMSRLYGVLCCTRTSSGGLGRQSFHFSPRSSSCSTMCRRRLTVASLSSPTCSRFFVSSSLFLCVHRSLKIRAYIREGWVVCSVVRPSAWPPGVRGVACPLFGCVDSALCGDKFIWSVVRCRPKQEDPSHFVRFCTMCGKVPAGNWLGGRVPSVLSLEALSWHHFFFFAGTARCDRPRSAGKFCARYRFSYVCPRVVFLCSGLHGTCVLVVRIVARSLAREPLEAARIIPFAFFLRFFPSLSFLGLACSFLRVWRGQDAAFSGESTLFMTCVESARVASLCAGDLLVTQRASLFGSGVSGQGEQFVNVYI